MGFDNRSIADSVQRRFVASKIDQKRVGCTIHRTRVASAGEPSPREGGGGSFPSAAGPTLCAPTSTGEITHDGQAYVAWLETIHPDRSGNSVETNDRK